VSELEKRGNFAHFPNFCFKTLIGTITAMNFKPGMNILHHCTTLAANSESRPLPVWAGQARKSIAFEKRYFMALFGGSSLGTGGLLRLLPLNL
jgi:hypothetical protein